MILGKCISIFQIWIDRKESTGLSWKRSGEKLLCSTSQSHPWGYCKMLQKDRDMGSLAFHPLLTHHSRTFASSSKEADIASIPLRRGYPKALMELLKKPWRRDTCQIRLGNQHISTIRNLTNCKSTGQMLNLSEHLFKSCACPSSNFVLR